MRAKIAFIIIVLTVLFTPTFLFAQQPVVETQGNTSLSVPEIIPSIGGEEIVDPRRLLNAEEFNLQKPEPRINIPGVNFSDPKVYEEADGAEGGKQVLIYSSYLAEYIIAIYQYAVAIASLLAVIMIIIAGFEWVVSGGNQESIGQAKKRITNAVTGLVLAVGSYTILYTINPELVRFRPLKTNYIQTTDVTNLVVIDKGFSGEVKRSRGRGVPGKGLQRAARIQAEDGPCKKDSEGCATSKALIADEFAKKISAKIVTDTTISSEVFRNIDNINCPMSQPTKITYRNPSLQGTTVTYTPPPFTVQQVIEKYSSCLRTDPTILSEIIKKESSFRTNAFSSLGFAGLAQTKTENCEGYLKDYSGLAKYCRMGNDIRPSGNTPVHESLLDPEVGVMVTVGSINQAVQAIIEKCTDQPISLKGVAYFSYIAHNTGLETLKFVLQNSCDPTRACESIYKKWQTVYGKNYNDNKEPPNCSDIPF